MDLPQQLPTQTRTGGLVLTIMQSQGNSIRVLGSTIVVDPQYLPLLPIDQDSYDISLAVQHRESGLKLAVRRMSHIKDIVMAKRCLREIRVLHKLRFHPCFPSLKDLEIAYLPDGSIREVHLYEELTETTLYSLIGPNALLNKSDVQSITYQLTCGLTFLHSAGIIHRNLNPGCIRFATDNEDARRRIKICDFVSACGYYDEADVERASGEKFFVTEYSGARWYRAPEILLGSGKCCPKVDVWSAGCIMAALLGGKALFQGTSDIGVLSKILDVLGTPSEAALWNMDRKAPDGLPLDLILSFPFKPKLPLFFSFPDMEPIAIDLLGRLLEFDPDTRIRCATALKHPYFAGIRDDSEEFTSSKALSFHFEEAESVDEVMDCIEEKVESFRSKVRMPNMLGRGGTR